MTVAIVIYMWSTTLVTNVMCTDDSSGLERRVGWVLLSGNNALRFLFNVALACVLLNRKGQDSDAVPPRVRVDLVGGWE